MPAVKKVKQEKVKEVFSSSVHVITAKELKHNLSFDYNCRAPSTHSKAYISMRETLREAPEMFIKLNGGITLADNYILDGGHTYLAITDAIKSGDLVDPSLVQVRVSDMGKLSKDEMAMRSVALNRRVTPPLTGEKDIMGHWDKLKTFVKPAKLFEFRPNTNPDSKYDVSFLVALLNGWYSKTADKSYSSKGSLVRLYNDDKYANLLPLLPQMIEVYSFVYRMLISDEKVVNKLAGYNEKRQVVLPNGDKIDGYLPEAYIWPIYGAVQSLIDEQGEMAKDPIVLINSKKVNIIKTLMTDYKRTGSGPAKYGRDSVSYLNMAVAILGSK